MNNDQRFWIGVACKDHVKKGVKLGIAQFCHGKKGPANRPSKGDGLIYYSSKLFMDKPDLYQKFTAIGKFSDEKAYQGNEDGSFNPFRRNVEYFESEDIEIKPLIEKLYFIRNKKSWGYVFRFGFFEIDKESFDVIGSSMVNNYRNIFG